MIASHNSMSYLPVKYWLMKPFGFIAKCQSKNIAEQCSEGITFFDVRVHLVDKVRWEFAHGLIDYQWTTNTNIAGVLAQINISCVSESPIVRLVLEKVHNKETDFKAFANLCEKLKASYPNIIFCGGVYKKNWKVLYDFGNNFDKDIVQYVGSMAKDAKWYEKFIPKLYAKRMNETNIKNMDNSKFNFFDFV